MVATEQLTVGNLTSFLLYAAYVGISIGGLSSFYTELNKGVGAASRLWDIIDRVPAIPVSGNNHLFYYKYDVYHNTRLDRIVTF